MSAVHVYLYIVCMTCATCCVCLYLNRFETSRQRAGKSSCIFKLWYTLGINSRWFIFFSINFVPIHTSEGVLAVIFVYTRLVNLEPNRTEIRNSGSVARTAMHRTFRCTAQPYIYLITIKRRHNGSFQSKSTVI